MGNPPSHRLPSRVRTFPGADTIASLVQLDEITAAAETLRGVSRRTPLWPIDADGGGPLRLKCENLQRGGSFKLRGAYNYVAGLSREGSTGGVITYSSGNHGRAVALAARELGLPAVVVVPEDIPRIKADAIGALGAELVEAGTTSLERQRRAEELAEARGLAIVPPFDDRRIIAGQGTVGLEIAEDWPAVERVVVPIGGGGLVSGVAAAVRSLVPTARVYGVEPRGAASMSRSIDAGEPVTLESVDTVADGLKPVRPGNLTLEHVRNLVHEVVEVEDPEILEAASWCARECKLLVEPSGAAALAAVRSARVSDPDAGTAVILSGGNVDPAEIGRWNRAPTRARSG